MLNTCLEQVSTFNCHGSAPFDCLQHATRLTETDHDGSVYHETCMLWRVAVDATISPEISFLDLMILVARERLEHLWEYDPCCRSHMKI